ncbi:NAD-dependent epimerase/dehydratase family protein [Lysobacter korlensis]|uniref:NAD-dependent epimerase/dehydratase family protein n=1 Tax=Lysobacter korlensis TaxID=553636 RepID=A0ABV6RUI2_9GAMM
MKRAIVIGGTGQIARAAAPALEQAGFAVTLASRSGATVGNRSAIALDREDTEALRDAADGFDTVVDTVAFTTAHAEQLLSLDAGNLVVISTGSVYADSDGRYLDVSEETGFPEYPDPVTEDQPTVTAEGPGYSADKSAMERVLLAGRTPVSILRPGAIHGPGGSAPRELFFVQRALDRRRRVPLAYGGRSRFSTSATANIAALIALCAEQPGNRALNAVDDEAPTVAEIGQIIFGAMGWDAEIVPLEGPPVERVGASPWGVPSPLVLSMDAAHRLGYRPAATYADAVRDAVEWILEELRDRHWRAAFPAEGARIEQWFPYEAEDALLKRLNGPV